MSPPATDWNLLFGILAWQMNFVSKDALLRGMNAWILGKAKPLGQILQEQGVLAAETLALLNALVEKHLELHGDDPQRSLAALNSPTPLRDELWQFADPDLNASLAIVSRDREGAADWWPPRSDAAPPSWAGRRFFILRPHARGGLGEVFVAADTELHREVALKEIQEQHADHPESRARFLLEAEITGRLEHPGIVPVYGLGTYDDGRPFYAMRFIKGDSLREAIARFHHEHAHGPQPLGFHSVALRELLGRFVDVCNAIAYAHSRGVLHRDLKPGNIMLGPYGETLVVDWGLAKATDKAETSAALSEEMLRPKFGSGTAPTQLGKALGTPGYMSPEQAAGRLNLLGPASDVYSLGATLYALLTGTAPFKDDPEGGILQRVERGEFAPPRQVNRQVPPALEAICLQAMALQPEQRYASPRALADDIERWLADEPVSAFREPLTARLGRWVRRHRALVTSGVVLLATAAVALAISTLLIGDALHKEEQARKERALAQVEALLTANPRAVPALLDGLKATRADVLPRLHELWKSSQRAERVETTRRVRVGLALLALDGGAVNEPLHDWILHADDPQEVLLLRDVLRPQRATLAPALWQATDAAKVMSEQRFQALVALAAFDPENPRWRQSGDQVVTQFLSENPLHLGLWVEALRPVRPDLLPPLAKVFRKEMLPGKEQLAADILANYAADQPKLLTELMLDADPRQWAVLFPRLRFHTERVTPLLQKELAKPMPAEDQVASRDVLARRQAQAAVALAQLGHPEVIWPLLEHTPDPSRRSYLTHLLGRLKSDVGPLLARLGLGAKLEVSERRALILALGEFTADELPAARRQQLVALLLKWYRDDPDPGIHSAIDWLLRHGQQGPTARKLDWGQGPALARIDAELAGQEAGERGWYVTGKEGHTFAVIREPPVFFMGSPRYEPGRLEIETVHPRAIPRSFAIATKTVTVGQFRRFLEATPKFQRQHNYTKKYAPEDDCPQTAVTWYEAAAYCNWLSQQEGIPEDQWCYPKDAGDIKEGMVMETRYLDRKGYRLPTEAEWEYACRARAVTSCYHGTAEGLLGEYAWYAKNSGERTRPVGQLKPNDLGLFDVLGNVYQWCQTRNLLYPKGENPEGYKDNEDSLYVIDERSGRVLRGGSFDFHAPLVRCAFRSVNRPGLRYLGVGLRPARTYP